MTLFVFLFVISCCLSLYNAIADNVHWGLSVLTVWLGWRLLSQWIRVSFWLE